MDRTRPAPQPTHGLCGHELARLPRDEGAATDLERQIEERGLPGDIGGWFTGGSASHQAAERAQGVWRHLHARLRRLSEDVLQELFGVGELLAGVRMIDRLGGLEHTFRVAKDFLCGRHGDP